MVDINTAEEHRCNCRYCHAWAALGFSARSGPLFYAAVGAFLVLGLGVMTWLMHK